VPSLAAVATKEWCFKEERILDAVPARRRRSSGGSRGWMFRVSRHPPFSLGALFEKNVKR